VVGWRWGVIVAKFCMESLHFLYTDVIGCTQFQLVHGGSWVQVDVLGEGARLKR